MRPPVPDLCPQSRKPSFEQPAPPWSDPRNAAPSTFFLTRDHGEDDERSMSASNFTRESTYGVQSLEDTVQEASLAASTCGHTETGLRGSLDSKTSSTITFNRPYDQPDTIWDSGEAEGRPSRRRSTLRPFGLLTSTSQRDASVLPADVPSPRPLTPLGSGNADDSYSLPSSPKSLSNQSMKPLDDISITDDMSSQAFASGEDDDESPNVSGPEPNNLSQLIMPSIKMPSRRPFTDRGKAIGRFKLLVAGASGSGKTSLIKSVVQACEDIVHVDQLHPSEPSQQRRTSRLGSQSKHDSAALISEIYASTKPYPSWWSDLEDSRVLRRRRKMDDVVLERNLCFVDVLGKPLSQVAQTDAIVQYMQQQLFRAASALSIFNADFQNLLAGNGGSQVDAILYLISDNTLATDIECIRKLCELSNVIPVISKADLLSQNQIDCLRSAFQEGARRAGIRTFLFGDGSRDSEVQPPFAVSSAKSNDEDNMDASVLMNPDYVQPLVPSELKVLVDNLFDQDNLAWLRHSAAKKLSQRRSMLQQTEQLILGSPNLMHGSLFGLSSLGGSACSLDGLASSHPIGSSSSYTIARLVDHTQREEKLAQVRLAKWAEDLQQSLQNERERYAALAKGERAVWLTERLSECIVDGSLVPTTQNTGVCGIRAPNGSMNGVFLDPLGFVRWTDDLMRRGWTIVQIVGSFGVVGGLALWLARTWSLPSRSLAEWHFDWCGTHE